LKYRISVLFKNGEREAFSVENEEEPLKALALESCYSLIRTDHGAVKIDWEEVVYSRCEKIR
jgi:Txe/YoeB family toxin of Txe-Axe toxin-antitoxin module